jgi:hypothetical protein
MILLIPLKSGWQDSNLRPPAPKAGAIPGYATPRKRNYNKNLNRYRFSGCKCMNFSITSNIFFKKKAERAGLPSYRSVLFPTLQVEPLGSHPAEFSASDLICGESGISFLSVGALRYAPGRTLWFSYRRIFCKRFNLRRERDSNPRYSYPYVSLANWWFQPLTHPSE